ncbi:MAG TPA: hypothetical protein VHP11_05955 [Tepidisphaeraceae bacterium]|nr:hypothetical protein [Tepidisphaeraceae bacterium]
MRFIASWPILGLLMSVATLARGQQPELWLYYPVNLQVDQNVPKLETQWRRAAKAGYTHVLLADSKMARLGDLQGMEGRYFANVERVKKIAAELNLQIVPGVFHVGYSGAMLWHDPNLAEGVPVKDSLFVVKGNEAKLVADPPVSLRAKPDWQDGTVAVNDGTATVRRNSGNARFVFKVNVAPFRCYHVAVKIRTDGYTGEPRIMPLGSGGKALQYQSLKAEKTQEWKQHHVIFNSLDNRQVTLYFGVWGDAKGELQWKDWTIEEVGLLNVLRRPGTPCTVKGYAEGKDYEPIADPRMGNVPWRGEYEVWHEPPVIKTRGIADGTQLRVSWYHPVIIYQDQVGCCPSDPKTMALLADEAKRVRAAWNAKGYMMSHDEIRCMNWDESCQKLNLDAGQILAQNARDCTKLLAGSTVYAWSDMFDPHHNAVKDYYLVRGNLAGVWEGLDPSVVVMNWNFDKRDQSLKFFADRGHKQVIAGYYDDTPDRIKEWLKSAEKVRGVVGVMYTTWANNYEDMETFAKLVKENWKR